MQNKFQKWKTPEENRLKEMVGFYTIPVIATKLGRNEGGIERKLEKLGISTRNSTDDVTAYSLASLLNVDSHTVLLWIDKYGLPYKRRITKFKKQNLFIKPERFWMWAERNKHRINFSKIPKHALPPEPEWVDVERKKDREIIPTRHQQIWTPEEDRELLRLTAKGIFQKDIGKALNRPTRGVQKRLAFLRKKD
ncbi:DNA-binding protein [Paenibacillus oralis]|uniref:DNA-binding protein n=1 Tax=Paenibacillus oralis TaxID=2490856 RepID=A0A3P3TE48_9BACL|nr:DNA-binding protein [Paenibacillus oralis]RRJ54713.1 DNA-binding protein [Paenibacillus oralis]